MTVALLVISSSHNKGWGGALHATAKQPRRVHGGGYFSLGSTCPKHPLLKKTAVTSLSNLRSVCRTLLLATAAHPSLCPQRARMVSTKSNGLSTTIKWKLMQRPLRENLLWGAGKDAATTQQREELLMPETATVRQTVEKDPAPHPYAFFRAGLWNATMYGIVLANLALLASSSTCHQTFISMWFFDFCANQFTSLWSGYCTCLDSHPLLTKVVTGIICGILGDSIAQLIQYQNDIKEAQQMRGEQPQLQQQQQQQLQQQPFVFNVLRTARLVTYGAVVSTPIGHTWFQLLDAHVMPEAMTSAPAVLTKMMMDQLLMSPLTTALFFVVMRSWEGHLEDSVSYMRCKLWPTMRANYALWPLAHIINFAFVPPSQRILFCSALGVVWTAILSTIQNEKLPMEPE